MNIPIKSAIFAVLVLGGGAQQTYGTQFSAPMADNGLDQKAAIAEAEELCKAKFQSTKKETPFVKCMSDAEVAYWAPINPILHQTAVESRVEHIALAERLDAGAISREKYDAERSLIFERSKARALAINAQYQMQKQQQYALQQQQSLALISAGTRMMSGPPTVTCRTWLDTTTCR